ncbi:MAG: efflux transporter periplasmic adaptor subunit, partial [Marivirga sp.]|nr:efflux transporter periplasmic adaptor subunit [Marivirga sp.]
MKAKKLNIKTFFLNLFVWVSIAFSFMACSASSEKESNAEAATEEHHEDEEGTVEFSEVQFKATGIQLGGIEKRQLSGTLKVNGLLDVPPQNQVSVSVPFGGILKSTDLLQGTWVNKGQVIARMEHPDYI